MRRGRVWLCKLVIWGRESSYVKSAHLGTQTRALRSGARVTVAPIRPAHPRLRRKLYLNQNNLGWLYFLPHCWERFNLVARVTLYFEKSKLILNGANLHCSKVLKLPMQLLHLFWACDYSEVVHRCINNGTLICDGIVHGAVVKGTWLPRHTY